MFLVFGARRLQRNPASGPGGYIRSRIDRGSRRFGLDAARSNTVGSCEASSGHS